MGRLVADLWRFIVAYWRADRIRVSPLEGQWLRMAPGSVLVFAGEPYQVRHRSVTRQTGGTCLELLCQGRRMSGRLCVFGFGSEHGGAMEWESAAGRVASVSDQLELYPLDGSGALRD